MSNSFRTAQLSLKLKMRPFGFKNQSQTMLDYILYISEFSAVSYFFVLKTGLFSSMPKLIEFIKNMVSMNPNAIMILK